MDISTARTIFCSSVARTRPLNPEDFISIIGSYWMLPTLKMPPFTPYGTPLPQGVWKPESIL